MSISSFTEPLNQLSLNINKCSEHQGSHHIGHQDGNKLHLPGLIKQWQNMLLEISLLTTCLWTLSTWIFHIWITLLTLQQTLKISLILQDSLNNFTITIKVLQLLSMLLFQLKILAMNITHLETVMEYLSNQDYTIAPNTMETLSLKYGLNNAYLQIGSIHKARMFGQKV